MADAAARREARRRRILENSENRLQKITGKVNENSKNDISDKSNEGPLIPTKSNIINGFVAPKSISTDVEIQTKGFKNQDANSEFEKLKYLQSHEQLQEVNSILTQINNTKNEENETKEKSKNCDNLQFNSNSTSFIEQSTADELSKDIYLYSMFFSPVSSLILAACLNILLLMNANFSVYTGIIMPFIILMTTQLCLGKSQDFQGSSMLIAALVLCNIKPEVVYTFKKLFTLLDTIIKNFALYITSFIFINWSITSFVYKSKQIQFL